MQYVFDRGTGLWRWAINAADVPFPGFRTVFTDSRNQKPAASILDYPNYVPPGEVGCTNEGSRNHDVFHAFVDARVAVNAIATFKQLSGSVDRGFPITVTNGTNVNKFFGCRSTSRRFRHSINSTRPWMCSMSNYSRIRAARAWPT